MTKSKKTTIKNRDITSYIEQVKQPQHLLQVRIPVELFEDLEEIKSRYHLNLKEIVMSSLLRMRDELLSDKWGPTQKNTSKPRSSTT